jgi:chromate transporter
LCRYFEFGEIIEWADTLKYQVAFKNASYFHQYRKFPGIAAFVNGVTVAAVGAITGSVIVLGRRSLVDVPTMAIALITLALLWKFGKKPPEPLVVVVAAIVGLIVYPLTNPR